MINIPRKFITTKISCHTVRMDTHTSHTHTTLHTRTHTTHNTYYTTHAAHILHYTHCTHTQIHTHRHTHILIFSFQYFFQYYRDDVSWEPRSDQALYYLLSGTHYMRKVPTNSITFIKLSPTDDCAWLDQEWALLTANYSNVRIKGFNKNNYFTSRKTHVTSWWTHVTSR